MNLYNILYQLLKSHPKARKSSRIKDIIWWVWIAKGYAQRDEITKEQFLKAPSPETITRDLRKVKEDHDRNLRVYNNCGCGCGIAWQDEDSKRLQNSFKNKYIDNPINEQKTQEKPILEQSDTIQVKGQDLWAVAEKINQGYGFRNDDMIEVNQENIDKLLK